MEALHGLLAGFQIFLTPYNIGVANPPVPKISSEQPGWEFRLGIPTDSPNRCGTITCRTSEFSLW